MTTELSELTLSALLKLHRQVSWALFLKTWWIPVGLIVLGIGITLYQRFIWRPRK